jgi:RimK family alpha-L-glutamate ligase
VRKHSPGRKTTSKPLLVVVYGLKTADHTYFNLFYPARRLAQEAENRGIPLRFLFPAEVPAFLDARDPGIAPDNTLFLFRGSVPVSIIELVERRGFTAINPSRAVRLSCDKRETARFLAEHGIPHPRLFGPDEVRTLQWPVVAKPRFGSRGTGVRLVSGPEVIPAPDTPDGEYLLQEYIEPSHGRDFRVFFAFDRILAAVERRAGNSRSGERDLVSNTCTGGSMHPSPFSPPVPDTVAALTAEIARKTGLEYGTIDFLYATQVPDPSQLLVCELNAFPGFTALEKEGGFDIAGPLIDALAGLFFSK